jgi:hypothetical protein
LLAVVFCVGIILERGKLKIIWNILLELLPDNLNYQVCCILNFVAPPPPPFSPFFFKEGGGGRLKCRPSTQLYVHKSVGLCNKKFISKNQIVQTYLFNQVNGIERKKVSVSSQCV